MDLEVKLSPQTERREREIEGAEKYVCFLFLCAVVTLDERRYNWGQQKLRW
jgi:hypothetical protein